MKILSVFDRDFENYGRVISLEDKYIKEIMDILADVPMTEKTDYVEEYRPLQESLILKELSNHLFGGLPTQLGLCNGHNTKLNWLEYHRSSEFNIGTEDFILLIAKQSEIIDNRLDTNKVKAFKVPAGELVEIYATTLHYAPCQCDFQKGFCVLVALPKGTNGPCPPIEILAPEDKFLTACNKWRLAHKDSVEAADGAYVGLFGDNIDIANHIK